MSTKPCDCKCHVPGVVGFFHCFAPCCAQPDVRLYKSIEDYEAVHPPGKPWESMTPEEKRAAYIEIGMVKP